MTSLLQILNIGDVSTWMSQETLEDEDGFATKSILCMPIVNGQKTVIGVAQLINKVTDWHSDTVTQWHTCVWSRWMRHICRCTNSTGLAMPRAEPRSAQVCQLRRTTRNRGCETDSSCRACRGFRPFIESPSCRLCEEILVLNTKLYISEFKIAASYIYRVFQKDLNDLNLVYFTY